MPGHKELPQQFGILGSTTSLPKRGRIQFSSVQFYIAPNHNKLLLLLQQTVASRYFILQGKDPTTITGKTQHSKQPPVTKHLVTVGRKKTFLTGRILFPSGDALGDRRLVGVGIFMSPKLGAYEIFPAFLSSWVESLHSYGQ